MGWLQILSVVCFAVDIDRLRQQDSGIAPGPVLPGLDKKAEQLTTGYTDGVSVPAGTLPLRVQMDANSVIDPLGMRGSSTSLHRGPDIPGNFSMLEVRHRIYEAPSGVPGPKCTGNCSMLSLPEDLGARITGNVSIVQLRASEVSAPSKDLGARITGNLSMLGAPSKDLGARITGNVSIVSAPSKDLGARITGNVSMLGVPSKDLGARITGNVGVSSKDLGAKSTGNLSMLGGPSKDLGAKSTGNLSMRSVPSVDVPSMGRGEVEFTPLQFANIHRHSMTTKTTRDWPASSPTPASQFRSDGASLIAIQVFMAGFWNYGRRRSALVEQSMREIPARTAIIIAAVCSVALVIVAVAWRNHVNTRDDAALRIQATYRGATERSSLIGDIETESDALPTENIPSLVAAGG